MLQSARFPRGNDRRRFFFLSDKLSPIKKLVLEVEYFSSSPILLSFRYQEGAFQGTQLSDGGSSSLFPHSKGSACGNWNDDFWYWEAPTIRVGTLTTGTARGIDTAALRQQNNNFATIFGWFSSFGIGGGGPNALKWDGQTLFCIDSKGLVTLDARLTLSNGVPTAAHIQPRSQQVRAKPWEVKYTYDPATVPMPFPKIIHVQVKVHGPGKSEASDPEDGGIMKTMVRLVIKEIELGDKALPLPRDMFAPQIEMQTTPVIHVVFTNGQNFVEHPDGSLTSTALTGINPDSPPKKYNLRQR